MDIGDTFRTKCKREKDRKTVVILHDDNTNKRFLWYVEGNIRIGESCLLYGTEYLGKSSKEDIKRYSEKSNALKLL